jgi:hypothetical protein
LELLCAAGGNCELAVRVVASHFYQFSVSDLDQVSPSTLESILRDASLVVKDEDSVFEIVHRRASADLSYLGLLEFVRFEFVSRDCMARAIELISDSVESITLGVWSSLRTRLCLSVNRPLRPGQFDSGIILEISDIFSVFNGKRLQLLYRGSRDGFGAAAFHEQCNGHPNTVTLILSTNDCIFGGYTPLVWGSRMSPVSDPSLTSFLFTIKNPRDLPPQIFKLKQADKAIYHSPSFGPVFGAGLFSDLRIGNQCQEYHDNYSDLGGRYTNDTAVDRLLTDGQHFAVKEIEVFEVI